MSNLSFCRYGFPRSPGGCRLHSLFLRLEAGGGDTGVGAAELPLPLTFLLAVPTRSWAAPAHHHHTNSGPFLYIQDSAGSILSFLFLF
jgi:hypothetical protein